MAIKININSVFRLFMLALSLLPVVMAMFYIQAFSINVPLGSEWEFFRLARTFFHNQDLHVLSFSKMQNEQASLWTHLPTLLLGSITHFNCLTNMWGSIVLLVSISVLLVAFSWRYFRDANFLYLFVMPIILITFNFRQSANWLVGDQITVFASTLFFLLMLGFLSKVRTIDKYFAFAALWAFLSALSSNSGMLSFLLGFIQLLIQKYLPLEGKTPDNKSAVSVKPNNAAIIFWVMLSIAFIGTWLYLNKKFISSFLGLTNISNLDLNKEVLFFLSNLGSPFTDDLNMNAAFGIVVFLLFLWALYTFKQYIGKLQAKPFIVPFMLFAYGVVFCALMPIQQLKPNIDVLVSNYATIPSIAFAGLYMFIVGASLKIGRQFDLLIGFVFALFFLMVGIGTILGWLNGPVLLSEHLKQQQIAKTFAIQSDQMLGFLYPNIGLVKDVAPFMQSKKWSCFSNESSNLNELQLIPIPTGAWLYYPLDTINNQSPMAGLSISICASNEPDIIFIGWALEPETKLVVKEVICLVDHKYLIPAAYGFPRLDISDLVDNPMASKCGFWASYRSNYLGKGSHQLSLIIIPDNKHYYCLPNIAKFTVQ